MLRADRASELREEAIPYQYTDTGTGTGVVDRYRTGTGTGTGGEGERGVGCCLCVLWCRSAGGSFGCAKRILVY